MTSREKLNAGDSFYLRHPVGDTSPGHVLLVLQSDMVSAHAPCAHCTPGHTRRSERAAETDVTWSCMAVVLTMVYQTNTEL